MTTRVSDEALDILFRRARTFGTWVDKPVPEELLRGIYDVMKWGPTSLNGCPVRILFLRTKEAKERLRPALAPGNLQKTMAAPVTAIIANDMKFYEKLPKLMPHNPNAAGFFENSPELADVTARRNATLQGAYFMLAARALGWIADLCPASIIPGSTRSSSGRVWNGKGCARSTRREG